MGMCTGIPDGCTLIFLNDTSTNCDCFDNSSILQCSKMGPAPPTARLFSLDSSTLDFDDENCAGSPITQESDTADIPPGFYILENTRFCVDQCIARVFFQTDGPRQPNLQHPVTFYVYQRYDSDDGRNSRFVQRFSSDSTLMYSDNVLEATLTSSFICVKPGDYLGVYIREDVGIKGIGTLPSSVGSYHYESTADPNFISCSSSPVVEVDVNSLAPPLLLLSVQYASSSKLL